MTLRFPAEIVAAMKLYVGGVGVHGAGYPNAKRTIALLRERPALRVVEHGSWLPEDFHLWKLARLPLPIAFWRLFLLFLANLRSMIRVLASIRREHGLVYVPYPAIFFLFGLSLVPRRLRPRCIADAYISIWDSLAKDRAVAKPQSAASRFLKGFEGRALHSASVVVVDTQANRDMFIKEFGLAPDKVYSIPLAIDEDRLIRAESVSRPSRERLRIFFVGTLIPLHGIEVILDAFALLAGDARFEFCLVGDGQQSDLVEAFITQHPHVNLRWIRDWCPLDRIASEIASSDICLGVFGGAGKAARVLPFKVYMYLAAGKAVITQPMYSLPAGCPPLPVMTAPDSLGIATAVEALLTPEKRRSLGIQGARYYSEFLSNAAVARAWEDLLRA